MNCDTSAGPMVADRAAHVAQTCKCYCPRRVRFVTRTFTRGDDTPMAMRRVFVRNGRLHLSRFVVLWVRPGHKNADKADLRRTFARRSGRLMTIHLAAPGGPATTTGNCLVTPEGVAFAVVAGLTGRERFAFGERNQLLTLDANHRAEGAHNG